MVLQAIQGIGRSILSGQSGTDTVDSDFTPIPQQYDLYQAYYDNSVYSASGSFRDTRTGVYVNIRPIHNPIARVVDWYAGRVYPGTWTADGLPADGKPNRFPYSDDTDEAIRRAVQQAFSWGAAGFDIGLYVRSGATLGDVFAEVVSDPEREKVYPVLTHPRFLTDAEWNATGDLIRYRLDIPRQDEGGRSYMWGKVVTKEFITTLKDGRSHGYDGQPETIPNPWGFVPAVLVQHRNIGGQHGAPAFAGVLDKLDYLNGIASAIDDYIMKFTDQRIIISTEDPKGFYDMVLGSNDGARPSNMDEYAANKDLAKRRSELKVAAAKPPLAAVRFIENLGLADAVPHFEKRLAEIESSFSEITFNEKLLSMSNPSGKAAEALTHDPQHKLDEAAANYDAGIVKLGQMCISIAAQCIRDGIWTRPFTAHQERFAPFTPESYDRGELQFSMRPRTLIPETMEQKVLQAAAIERLTTDRGLRYIGFDEDEAAEQLMQNREAQQFEADLSGRQFSAGSLFG